MKKHLVIVLLMFFVSKLVLAQDIKALNLVEAAEKAMGGKKAFQKLNIISWNFFGSRNLVWDKKNNKLRIDFIKENSVYLLDMNTSQGKVFSKGEEVSNADSLKKYLESARKIWINDSYWLLMPFKLKDPGVNLKYIGKSIDGDESSSDVVEVTFNSVGVTPDNKYHIEFDKNTHLVNKWSYFQSYKDPKPRFTMPWLDYKSYQGVLLSGDRGERKLSNIKVFKTLDEKVFNTFDKPEFLK